MAKYTDITGKRFGSLTALRLQYHVAYKYRVKDATRVQRVEYWLCSCDCGGQVVKQKPVLRRAEHPRCRGCEVRREGPAYLGRLRARKTWSQMKQRCGNPRLRVYWSYAAKGVTLCDSWKNSFENFLKDMGPQPPGKTLMRIDLSAGYNKANCLWAAQSDVSEIRALLKAR